jgi:hypothetical protein
MFGYIILVAVGEFLFNALDKLIDEVITIGEYLFDAVDKLIKSIRR